MMKSGPKVILVAGILLSLGAPCLGIICTVIAMIGAFHAVGHDGIADPSLLARAIGEALLATWAGLIIGMIGWPLVLAGALWVWSRKRIVPLGNPPSRP